MTWKQTPRSPRLARAGALTLLAGMACSGAQEPGLEREPDPSGGVARAALIVSNPTASAAHTAFPGSGGSAAGGFVYASLPPGSIPNGTNVVIETRRTGVQVTAEMVEGGFDPVPVAADAGDTLDVRVTLSGDLGALAFVAVVPRSRPPVVVRTDPPPKKRDVPLNAVLLVVFSEPIDPATLTASAVQLTLGGVPVVGTLAFGDAAHLTVTFTPINQLAAAAEYTLVVTQAIRDLDGDALAAAVTETFVTVASVAGTIYDRVSAGPGAGGSRIVFGENGRYSLQSQLPDYGFFEHLGSYVLGDSGITLTFDYAPCCAPREAWTAVATQHADSLVVTHAFAPDLPFVEDGVYVRSEDVAPTTDAGGRIAFTYDDDGVPETNSSSIYVISPDGSGVERLAEGTAPAWSRDGGRIAFARNVVVHVMNADGSNPVALGAGLWPSWSPDGTQITFVRDTVVMVMDADGSNDRVLITLTSPGMPSGANQLRRPVWSPDGSRIAFESRGGPGTVVQGALQVHIVDADGTNLRQLAGDGWSTYDPAWSPDGERIAVHSYDYAVDDSSGTSFDEVVASYPASGGGRVLHYRSHTQWLLLGIDWSPDGRYLTFRPLLSTGSRILILDVARGIVYPLMLRAVAPGDAGYVGAYPVWSRN